MTIQNIDIYLSIAGYELTTNVISYERVKRLCGGTGVFSVTLDWNIPTIPLYSSAILYERDYETGQLVKKGTYIVGEVTKNVSAHTIEIICYDNSKRLNDYFIDEVYNITYLSSTKTWIEKFLDEADVSYNFNNIEYPMILSENTSLGTKTAWEEIAQLIQQNGWYLYFDANNTAQIGVLDIASEEFVKTINDENILEVHREVNDSNYRNKAVVWGTASPVTQNWVFASSDWHGWMENEYGEDDVRAVVLSNSSIPSVTDAQILANKMVKEFAKIDNYFTILLPGFWNLDLTDRIFINSRFCSGAGNITTISTKFSSSGVFTEVTLNERCPRLFGYWGYSGYVYVGTEGNGIWRKPLRLSSTWTDYSAGLTDKYIKDLAIYNGIFACVTDSGKLFVRESIDAAWRQVSTSVEDISTGTVYPATSGTFVAVTIDKITNEIIAGFNLNSEESLRSWLITYNPAGYFSAERQLRTVTDAVLSGSDYSAYSYDYTIYDLDNAGLSNFVVVSGIDATNDFMLRNGVFNPYSFRYFYEGTCDGSSIFEGDYTHEKLDTLAGIGFNYVVDDICYIEDYIYLYAWSIGGNIDVLEYNLKTKQYKKLEVTMGSNGYVYFCAAKEENKAYAGGYEGGTWGMGNVFVWEFDFKAQKATKILSKTNIIVADDELSAESIFCGLVGNKIAMVCLNNNGTEGNNGSVNCFYVNLDTKYTYKGILSLPNSFHGKLCSGDSFDNWYLYGDPIYKGHTNERFACGLIYIEYYFEYDEGPPESWSRATLPYLIYFDSANGGFYFTYELAEAYYANYVNQGGSLETLPYAMSNYGASYLSPEKNGSILHLGYVYYITYPDNYSTAFLRFSLAAHSILSIYERPTLYYPIFPHSGKNKGLCEIYFPGETEGKAYYNFLQNQIEYSGDDDQSYLTGIGALDYEGCFIDDANKIIGENNDGILYQAPLGFGFSGANYLNLTEITGYLRVWCVGNNNVVVISSEPAIHLYRGNIFKTAQPALLKETNGLFYNVTNLNWTYNIDISDISPIILYGGYFIPGSGTWGDPSYSVGALYASPWGEPGTFSSLLIDSPHDYVSDARSFSTLDSQGNYKRYLLFPQVLDEDHSETMLTAYDASNLGSYIIASGVILSGVTDLLTTPGYGSKIETTNLDDNPYIFMSVEAMLGGNVEYFYQRDSYKLGQTPTTFIDRKGNLSPYHKITVIRVDDIL